MWVFEHPGVLALLILVPVGIYFRHAAKSRGGVIRYPFRIWRGNGYYSRMNLTRILFTVASVSFWLGAVGIILALAGPAQVKRDRVYLSRGIDMMIVLDESPSMAAQDFVPGNRFETARDVIRRFVEKRENDPIGLVSFSKEAALRVPPTVDYSQLLAGLDDLSIMSLGDGTAIGMGIALGALHLSSSTASQKIIILLTDGKNNSGEILPETAARVAAQMGIRIYAIGIGNDRPTPLEFTDPRTGQVYRGSFEGGFDEALLQKIASISGGAYFYAGTSGTLEAVFRAIDSIETVEKRVRIEVKTTPRYREVLLLALGLILLDFVLRKLVLREVI